MKNISPLNLTYLQLYKEQETQRNTEKVAFINFTKTEEEKKLLVTICPCSLSCSTHSMFLVVFFFARSSFHFVHISPSRTHCSFFLA